MVLTNKDQQLQKNIGDNIQENGNKQHISNAKTTDVEKSPEAPHPYVGMWVTKDGYVRQELLPNGRYDEARGKRKSAYQGRYSIEGNHIEYVDDTGFTADGDFRDDVLYHGGMIFYREK